MVRYPSRSGQQYFRPVPSLRQNVDKTRVQSYSLFFLHIVAERLAMLASNSVTNSRSRRSTRVGSLRSESVGGFRILWKTGIRIRLWWPPGILLMPLRPFGISD